MRRIVKKAIRRISPRRIIDVQADKKVLQQFGDEFGLVYFGRVSGDDEYQIVRGLTLSTKHRDLHYSVGSYENYDVAFVERSDEVMSLRDKIKRKHRWHIMEFDLHTKRDLPHVFIGLHTHSEAFYMQLFTKYPTLRALRLGNTGQYPATFLATHRIYGAPGEVIDVERLITPEITSMIETHFGNLAVEITQGTLYLYSENAHLSAQLLEAMLKNGVWLSHVIDTQAGNQSN